jgi:hypothetical protein
MATASPSKTFGTPKLQDLTSQKTVLFKFKFKFIYILSSIKKVNVQIFRLYNTRSFKTKK